MDIHHIEELQPERVLYSPDKNTAYFDGVRFTRDQHTGYYLSTKVTRTGRRERLHRYVWFYFNGEIPEGFDIHLINEDKGDNDIDNLCCLPRHDHQRGHGLEKVQNNPEKIKRDFSKGCRYAAQWHRSEAGKKWHSEHGKKQIKPKEYICQYCGKRYISLKFAANKFCSNKCRAAARRKSGVDNEIRCCEMCGKEFSANKYSKTRFCSKSCTTKANHVNKTTR